MAIDGLTEYTGPVTHGLRGNVGGENARWGIDPKTGQEVPYLNGYLLSDLLQKFGSMDAIYKYGSVQPGTKEWYQKQQIQGDDPYFDKGMFTQDLDRFGARPNNDTFSGKDGLADLLRIGAMAAPVAAGAAGLIGSGVAGAGSVAGTAGFEGGLAATLGAAESAAPALGSGLTAGSSTGGIGGGALGSGLSTGSTASGIGAGATGTGISSGLAGAGSALTPGYFAAEGLGSTGGGATSGLASSVGPGTGLEMALRGLPGIVGAISANNQANKSDALAQQYMALGAPSRARFEASYAPGFSMESDPGYLDALNQASKASLHSLSVTGNPAGSPNAWAKSLSDLYQQNAYTALQNYRNQNSGAGGLSGALQASTSPANNAITQQGNVAGSLGGAAADIFTPRKSISEILGEIRRSGY